MANTGFKTWRCGLDGPSTHDDLRTALTALAKQKRGRKLISDTFAADHPFAGLSDDTRLLAKMLIEATEVPAGPILLGALEATAQKEVLNWIERVPAKVFRYSAGVWSVSASGGLTKSLKAYDFATVDLDALRKLNIDDAARKRGTWLNEASRKPRFSCRFAKDGMPILYSMD